MAVIPVPAKSCFPWPGWPEEVPLSLPTPPYIHAAYSLAWSCCWLAVTGLIGGAGTLWGMFMASVVYNAIKHVRDPNIEITTLVVATMSTFWLAENVLGVSGVLGTVVFGVQTARNVASVSFSTCG